MTTQPNKPSSKKYGIVWHSKVATAYATIVDTFLHNSPEEATTYANIEQTQMCYEDSQFVVIEFEEIINGVEA